MADGSFGLILERVFHLGLGEEVIQGTYEVMENCLEDIIALFYKQASLVNLDSSCVNTNTRTPFVSWRDYSESSMFEFDEDIKPLLRSSREPPPDPQTRKIKK